MVEVLPWCQRVVDNCPVGASTMVVGEAAAGANEMALALAFKAIGAPTPHVPLDESVNEPDMLVVAPDNDKIKIEAVREAIDFLLFSPVLRQGRVLVFLQMEKMSLPACHVMLKTLEEPNLNKHIILSVRSPQVLPPPIVSRCHVLPVPLPSTAELKQWGGEVADNHFAFCQGSPLLLKELSGDWVTVLMDILAAGAKLLVGEAVQTFNDKRWHGGLWMDGLQKWVSDIVRVGCAGQPYYFPSAEITLKRLGGNKQKLWMNYYQYLQQRRKLIDFPLNKELYMQEILYEYRNLCAYAK